MATGMLRSSEGEQWSILWRLSASLDVCYQVFNACFQYFVQ